MKETRLFFVVDADNVNEEIFETLEHASEFANSLKELNVGTRVRICLVRNTFTSKSGYQYEDLANTFETVSDITSAVFKEYSDED